MGRYLILWEADESKIPLDTEERRMAWLGAIEMERVNMNQGTTKDWGCFIGTTKGFSISEGTKEEIMDSTIKFIPYFKFQIFEVANINELETAIKNM
ncbi:MAG: hypothetical protein ABFS43_12360 [Thermodesulfobacteriota bacterium]